MSTLRGFLDVRPDERRNTFAAFATLLAITSGHTLLETARDALFLAKLPVSQLPWMYLIIVVVAVVLAQIGRIGAKADSKGGVAGVLVLASVVTGGFWVLAADIASRPWILYALYIWSGLFASWVTVQFWTLLGRAHTMTQAKRLYGFIGAGAVLGAVVGAFVARAAMTLYQPRSMLLLAAALFVVAAFPCSALRVPSVKEEAPRERGTEDTEEKRRSSMTAGVAVLWQNAFARRVLGIVLVSTVTVTLVDFLFKAKLAERFHNDAAALGSYLSLFYAVTNTLALFAQLVAGPWIFRTIGVQRALFFFPVLMLTAASSVLVGNGAFITAVVLKGLDGTLRHSLHRTSTELLLVPVPDGTRERVKPIVDLIGSRGGQAVASLGILLLVTAGATRRGVALGAVILTLAVVWTSLVVTIRHLYLDVFRDTLRSGGLSGRAELPELDLGALETLFAGLNSSRDVEVLGALELLAEQNRERLIPALILYHPSRDVVLRSLEIFTRRGRTDFVSIADRLNTHPDREVAAAALRARTAVTPDRKLLTERLGDPCEQVSATALIALMARGWIDPDDAHKRIGAILASRSCETAAELARAIRDVGGAPDPRFDALLVRLARDAGRLVTCAPEEDTERAPPPPNILDLPPEVAVRLEVVHAMAVRKSPDFLPLLVSMLDRHELRAAARSAIAEIPGALEFLDAEMTDKKLPRNVRVHLPRTVALLPPDDAVRLLLSHLATESDGAVRFKLLRALVKLRRADPTIRVDEPLLLRSAEATLDHAGELRVWGAALTGGSDEPPSSMVSADPLRAAHHLLVDLVRDKETHATQRLFLLLELLYGSDFEDIARGIKSRNAKTRASSLELVENLVRPPLRARVVALVGDGAASSTSMTYEDAVTQILAKGGSTMRTLAEYRAVELGIDASAITGTRPSQAPTTESIARRLVDRARDRARGMLSPEVGAGESGAPA